MKTNYEKIKNMTVDEMAKQLGELYCAECGWQDNPNGCDQIDCWCHKSNGYSDYKQWLLSEVEQ